MGTFRAELAGYRSDVAELPLMWERELLLEVLDRWLAHPDTEKIWGQIQQAARDNGIPPTRPVKFIGAVLDYREQLRPVEEIAEKSPQLETDAARQGDHDFKSGRFIEGAIRKRAAARSKEARTRVLGRKPKTAAAKRFAQWCHVMLQTNCGRPFDDATATLTSVAFGIDVDVQWVRDTRKPTTASDRGHSRQK
jgi:hypothetical protein